ncbi:MAG: hypothetical protein ABI668_11060 [Sphingorhabdus sp.]
MRLLIYLLAMMTGFSVADAARPVSSTPATLGSAVAHGAVVAASVASVQQEVASASSTALPALSTVAVLPVSTTASVAVTSPVIRHDVARQ